MVSQHTLLDHEERSRLSGLEGAKCVRCGCGFHPEAPCTLGFASSSPISSPIQPLTIQYLWTLPFTKAPDQSSAQSIAAPNSVPTFSTSVMPPADPAAATPGQMDQPAANVESRSAAGASYTSSPTAAMQSVGAILSQTDPRQVAHIPANILPTDTVAPQAVGAAAQPLPQNADSECILKVRPRLRRLLRRLLRKTKLKSRARRILLPKFVLKGIVGSTAADVAYPLINPKARPAVPLVSAVSVISGI